MGSKSFDGQVARPVGKREARHAFANGDAVVVSVNGETQITIGALTTYHTRDTTTWDELSGTVKSYGDPRQRYYVAAPDYLRGARFVS